jgi:ribosomal protein S18 acetylase RimI-like enzyme
MIRTAVLDDVPSIVGVVHRAYARFVPVMDRIPAPMTDDYGALVTRGVVTVMTDGDDDVVVGVLVSWVDGDAYYVDNIAVDPDAQSTGVGSSLLEAAIKETWRSGCRRIWLYTNAAMADNIGYYERRGFVVYDRRIDKGFDRIFFERHLLASDETT